MQFQARAGYTHTMMMQQERTSEEPRRRRKRRLNSNEESILMMMRPLLMVKKRRVCTILLCGISLLHLASFLNTIQPASASYHRRLTTDNYDPEQQDGIPVFSARSVAKLDDEWNGEMQDSLKPRTLQRRQADNDLDDGLEEEDEDEYKSGSSPRESIESPGYGESRRFARDGDDIEDFFDKHLGPPKEHDSADETAEQPTVSNEQREEVTAPAIDPDDHFEVAASGPIASIFHSLLGHDRKPSSKRPILQISTSLSDGDSTDSTSSGTTGGSADVDSITTKGLKASQSAQSFVEAPPITVAIAPMTAQSSISTQEQPSHEQDSSDAYTSAAPTSSSEGIREIYIGRRPTVMSYLQQQQQQYKPQHPNGYSTAGSANVWRGPNGQPVVYEQEQVNDYSRNPGAASYVYQQQPSNAAQQSTEAANGDDEQTVTYGLSFGASAADAEPSSEQETPPQDSVSGIVDSPTNQQYTPYSTRYTTSSSRALNNYYNDYYRQPPTSGGYVRAYPVHPQQFIRQQQMVPSYPYRQAVHQYQQQQQQQQQYAGGAPTRYHRDPSESPSNLAAMQAALAHRAGHYDQSAHAEGPMQRGSEVESDNADEQQTQYRAERQRLLASLDREIKANPQYNANQATSGDASAMRNSYLHGPYLYNGRQMVTYKEVKKTLPGDELDTYTSYHSETDPYKTRTTTSRMINDPVRFLLAPRPQMSPADGYGPNHRHAGSTNRVANELPNMRIHPGQAGTHSDGQAMNPNREDWAHRGRWPQNWEKNSNLQTGPLSNYDNTPAIDGQADLLRQSEGIQAIPSRGDAMKRDGETPDQKGHSRVRRDDSDEREIDNDSDDDGVWVDDDEDDDNRQQSSDVNETSQHPEEESDSEDDGQQDETTDNILTPQQIHPPGVIGGPHGYELSPNDLVLYG